MGQGARVHAGVKRVPNSEPAPPLTKPTNAVRTTVSTNGLIHTLIFTASLAFTSSSTAQDTDWATQTIEAFKIYCYETNADHDLIVSMASALRLRALPDDLMPFVAGPDGTQTNAYFVEWDKDVGVSIMVGASQPDACSIAVNGLDYARVEATFKEAYRLVLGFRDDIGLSVNEMYVSGGGKGTKGEMFENGIVAVSYPKNQASKPGFSLSYMPPETARALLAP